jgi:hypothetical protein
LEPLDTWLTDLVDGELNPSNDASEDMGGLGGSAVLTSAEWA